MTALNIGAGADRRDGYVSVDLRPEVADVVASADALPYGDGEVDEILAFDILEHFPRARTDAVLEEWRRVLRPGGVLSVRVPNMWQLCRWVVEGHDVASAILNIYGGHRWGPDGNLDTHHWGWRPEDLEAELGGHGFRVISDDLALNFTVTAERM